MKREGNADEVERDHAMSGLRDDFKIALRFAVKEEDGKLISAYVQAYFFDDASAQKQIQAEIQKLPEVRWKDLKKAFTHWSNAVAGATNLPKLELQLDEQFRVLPPQISEEDLTLFKRLYRVRSREEDYFKGLYTEGETEEAMHERQQLRSIAIERRLRENYDYDFPSFKRTHNYDFYDQHRGKEGYGRQEGLGPQVPSDL
jgi:hypothetical protein